MGLEAVLTRCSIEQRAVRSSESRGKAPKSCDLDYSAYNMLLNGILALSLPFSVHIDENCFL